MKKIYFFALSLAFVFISTNAQVNLSSGLVAHYPFNGNANDASGNGNNGIVSGATLTADRFGRDNKSYYFNGLSDKIFINSFSTNLLDSFSISLWIRSVGDLGVRPYDSYICYGDIPNHTWNNGYNYSQNRFDLWNYNGASWYVSAPNSANQWLHVVHSYSNNTEYVYVNNQLLDTRTISLPLIYRGSNKLFFGSAPNDDQYFNGYIDDIRLYNRVLTSDEIEALYEECPTDLSSGLVAHYPFNGNANDASGNDNNGIVSGATLTADRFGRDNKSYYFNGLSDRISINSFSTNLLDSFSISLWIRSVGDLGVRPYDSYICYGDIPNHTWNNGYNYSQNRFDLWNYNGASWYVSAPNSANQWLHVVHSYSNNTEYVYVNNQLLDTRTISLPLIYRGSNKLFFGSAPNDDQYFNGYIDDIRLYNRVLTSCEIEALYTENDTLITTCSVNVGADLSICRGNTANLIASGSSNITSYLWSNGATTQSINVSPRTSSFYSVTAFGNGCSASDSVFVSVQNCDSVPVVPICIVSVDKRTRKNTLIWNKPVSTIIDSFLIYKETNQSGVYSVIGSQHYRNFSTFTDNNSNPSQQANFYKLGVKTSSGQLSNLSNYHKTIHLTINSGVGGVWNLIWNHYEGMTYSSYNIYRGTSSDSMTLLTTISASLNSYTDLTAPRGKVYYKIAVVNTNGCNPTAKTESYNESESNIVDNETITSIVNDDINSNTLFVYPNPNKGDFTIEVNKNEVNEMDAVLFNSFGQAVYQTKLVGSKASLSVKNLPAGIYLVKIYSDNKQIVLNRRIVVE